MLQNGIDPVHPTDRQGAVSTVVLWRNKMVPAKYNYFQKILIFGHNSQTTNARWSIKCSECADFRPVFFL